MCVCVCLVGGDWNMIFIFPYSGNNDTDIHIVQRGRCTTNQCMYVCVYVQ